MDFRKEKRRLVILAEGNFDFKNAKTACGAIRYGFHDILCIIDSEKAGMTAGDAIPGLKSNIPIVASLDEALLKKPDSLLIGVASRGGGLPSSWRKIIIKSLMNGMHIYSGLHIFLSDDMEFKCLAEKYGRILWDIRKPAKNLPVALGRCRKAKSFIVHTVGTDCSVGKMTAGLEIIKGLRKKGITVEFVSTGQTGILITGYGQPVDAIAGDFMAGSVEMEIMNLDEKVDMIFIEGQGSLLHPGYSSVTLGILHGSAPDALILCHQSTRKEVARGYKIPIPPLSRMKKIYEDAAGLIKKTSTVAVALNTSGLEEEEALLDITNTMEESGLPTADPVRFSPEIIIDALISSYEDYRKGNSYQRIVNRKLIF
jgi:D-glutamate N-acetyltransferase